TRWCADERLAGFAPRISPSWRERARGQWPALLSRHESRHRGEKGQAPFEAELVMLAIERYPRRLIEVDLPIASISANAHDGRSVHHGHITAIHIWWARKPLPSCRAV